MSWQEINAAVPSTPAAISARHLFLGGAFTATTGQAAQRAPPPTRACLSQAPTKRGVCASLPAARGDFLPQTSFGRHTPPRCSRSKPARNRLEPKPTWPPAPSGETWPRTGRTPGSTPRSTEIRGLVSGRGAPYRGDCVTADGSSAPISWWDGDNRQAAPGRPHGGGRILLTCTFLRLRGRGTGA
jgi:hypothetical protein